MYIKELAYLSPPDHSGWTGEPNQATQILPSFNINPGDFKESKEKINNIIPYDLNKERDSLLNMDGFSLQKTSYKS